MNWALHSPTTSTRDPLTQRDVSRRRNFAFFCRSFAIIEKRYVFELSLVCSFFFRWFSLPNISAVHAWVLWAAKGAKLSMHLLGNRLRATETTISSWEPTHKESHFDYWFLICFWCFSFPKTTDLSDRSPKTEKMSVLVVNFFRLWPMCSPLSVNQSHFRCCVQFACVPRKLGKFLSGLVGTTFHRCHWTKAPAILPQVGFVL